MSEHAPLGSFEEQVLLAVVRTAAEAYGMEVRREIERLTGRGISAGAAYATLDRLEAKGLLGSDRGRGDGTRRVFFLTGAGAAALAETRAIRDRLWNGIELRPYESG